MLWYVPHIYGDFHCIATACKHNCCIGWEIDIDDRTKEAYRGVAGPFGERLANSICEADGVSSFRLTEGERCPFLNCQNLCDIHLVLGEEALCQICRDHPRFRNYFSSRGEIGLGLSCEAAARLILNRQEPMTFIPLFDDGEDGVQIPFSLSIYKNDFLDAIKNYAEKKGIIYSNFPHQKLLRNLEK